MTEAQAMRRAVELAWEGWGHVAPNPMVGAVVVRDGRLLGEGFHAGFGGPHAEAVALAAAGDARGATCVVTLEPCAHHGKTPPCADALVAAGVARVVLAVRDPSPVAGGGVERLRAAGIEVEAGLLAPEAAGQLAPYLWQTVRSDRPFVALKLATSVDGYIADGHGRSRWISGPAARDHVHWLRAGFDGIGVGARTAITDDPALTVRGPVRARTPPARIVFSGTGTLPESLQLITTAAEVPTTVVSPAETADLDRAASSGVRVLHAATLREGLCALRAAGIGSVLVEGGGTLAGLLLDDELVDRLYWIQAPLWLGGGVPAFGTRRGRALPDVARWHVVERRALGPDTLLVADRELCLPES